MRPSPPRRAGFTVLELLTVLAIIAAVLMLSGAALSAVTRRSRLRNAVFEVAALLSVAQMRAQSTGRPHYVVFWEDGGAKSAGVLLVERDERPGGPPPPTWDAVDVSDPASLGGRVLERLRFEVDAGVDFAPLPTSVALPPPFDGVPHTRVAGGSPLLEACTFCIPGTQGARGALRFAADGSTLPATGTRRTGGTVGLALREGERPGAYRFYLTVASPAGLVRVIPGK